MQGRWVGLISSKADTRGQGNICMRGIHGGRSGELTQLEATPTLAD